MWLIQPHCQCWHHSVHASSRRERGVLASTARSVRWPSTGLSGWARNAVWGHRTAVYFHGSLAWWPFPAACGLVTGPWKAALESNKCFNSYLLAVICAMHGACIFLSLKFTFTSNIKVKLCISNEASKVQYDGLHLEGTYCTVSCWFVSWFFPIIS